MDGKLAQNRSLVSPELRCIFYVLHATCIFVCARVLLRSWQSVDGDYLSALAVSAVKCKGIGISNFDTSKFERAWSGDCVMQELLLFNFYTKFIFVLRTAIRWSFMGMNFIKHIYSLILSLRSYIEILSISLGLLHFYLQICLRAPRCHVKLIDLILPYFSFTWAYLSHEFGISYLISLHLLKKMFQSYVKKRTEIIWDFLQNLVCQIVDTK